ncbi:MAG: hypothetical protein V7L02_14075 [Nostoc sp.]
MTSTILVLSVQTLLPLDILNSPWTKPVTIHTIRLIESYEL